MATSAQPRRKNWAIGTFHACRDGVGLMRYAAERPNQGPKLMDVLIKARRQGEEKVMALSRNTPNFFSLP